MQDTESHFAVWAPRILGVLRVVVGLLVIPHGTAKLFGVPHIAMFDGLQLFSLLGFAGVLELVGGLMFVLGLYHPPRSVRSFGIHGSRLFHGARSKRLLTHP
jgi:putative oxidoreductase